MSDAWIRVEVAWKRVGDSFEATAVVVQAYGVPIELFVYRADDATYSHPCVADDLDRYPATREEALDALLGFYRQAQVTVTASTRPLLEAMMAELRYRLDAVVRAWSGASELLVPGTTSYVLGGD